MLPYLAIMLVNLHKQRVTDVIVYYNVGWPCALELLHICAVLMHMAYQDARVLTGSTHAEIYAILMKVA